MGVDPWADENEEHETRGGVSSAEGVDELEREARRRREQVRATANPPARPARPVEQRLFPPQWAPPPLTIPSPPRARSQFYNEGYREGVEEGKKATVQEGFNLGFREGATAGLAYGQARGAACSVAIFAGQVPGSSGWKASIAATTRTLEEMKPSAAAKSAREDFERVLAAEAAGSDPGTRARPPRVSTRRRSARACATRDASS